MIDLSRLQRLTGFLVQDPGNLALRCDALDEALFARRLDLAEQFLRDGLAVTPSGQGNRGHPSI